MEERGVGGGGHPRRAPHGQQDFSTVAEAIDGVPMDEVCVCACTYVCVHVDACVHMY